MCRYATVNYKQSYSCFKCRKTFKKITFRDYLVQQGKLAVFEKLQKCRHKSQKMVLEERFGTTQDEIVSEYLSTINRCPDCGGALANMGMDFKSPKKNDEKAWAIIRGMYDIGTIYQSCGCDAFGYVPKSKIDYTHYLHGILQTYEYRLKELERLDLSSYQRQEQGASWSQKISAILRELEKISS